MKVFELMAILAKAPAGNDVCVQHNGDSYSVNASFAENDEGGDYFRIVGSGKHVVTEDEEDIE